MNRSIARSPRIDYLSQLPNELLHQIYDKNYRDWKWDQKKPEWSNPKTLIAPISKRLLDVQRHQLYKSIVLESPQSLYRLSRLVQTVRERPALGSLVHFLRISVSSKEASDPKEQMIREELAGGGLEAFF
ncbi:hypothetical protein JCM5353_000536 [Sporobolomyces roseus]